MTNIKMWDTADRSFHGGIPDDAQAVLWYWDGLYANGNAARARFPAIFDKNWEIGLTDLLTPLSVRYQAPGCDSEPGNGGTDRVLPFVEASIKNGNWRPVIYADLSDIRVILPTLERVYGPTPSPGASRKFRLLTAHPGSGDHICGPHTCGQLHVDADGAQCWWGSIDGHGSVDADYSLVLDSFFPQAAAPDHMRYGWYDHVLRTKPIDGLKPAKSERQAVIEYDKLRALQAPLSHPQRDRINELRRVDLTYYRKRLGLLLAHRPTPGHRIDLTSHQSVANHWGWRYYRLARRCAGAVVHA